MTKISLILWAMNFMYGLGYIFLAFGIIAALGFCVFAVIASISHMEDPDNEKSSAFRKTAKYKLSNAIHIHFTNQTAKENRKPSATSYLTTACA